MNKYDVDFLITILEKKHRELLKVRSEAEEKEKKARDALDALKFPCRRAEKEKTQNAYSLAALELFSANNDTDTVERLIEKAEVFRRLLE